MTFGTALVDRMYLDTDAEAILEARCRCPASLARVPIHDVASKTIRPASRCLNSSHPLPPPSCAVRSGPGLGLSSRTPTGSGITSSGTRTKPSRTATRSVCFTFALLHVARPRDETIVTSTMPPPRVTATPAQRFVCVESARLKPVTLAPGFVWTGEANITVIDL